MAATPNVLQRAVETLVFGSRRVLLALFVVVTIAMAYFAAHLKVDAGFKKQIPLTHEYMQTFLDYEKEFGGANRILIAVMDKSGNMFNLPFLQTMEKITQDARTIDSVDEARLRSIFTPNVRFVEVVEDGFAGGNVIPPDFTPNVEGFQATPEQFDTIKANIEKANIVGRLVAKDFSGAMVWIDLVPEDAAHGVKLDYNHIASQLEAIRQKYEHGDTTVHIIGFAKVVGDISDGAKSVIYFFGITIVITWFLLLFYSGSPKLATLGVLAALTAVIWTLGTLKLLGFGIDPMNILTPFLIFAIGVSHGVQMINAWAMERLFPTGDPNAPGDGLGCSALEAAQRALRRLLVPGAIALAAGCVGFLTIMFIKIQIIQELAITASIGVALISLTNLVLLPLMLSFTELRNRAAFREKVLLRHRARDRFWSKLTHFAEPGPAAISLIVAVALGVFGYVYGKHLQIGDSQAGVPELRPESRFNRDARMISEHFALGVDQIYVIAESGPNACTQSYAAMETIDRFAWHMRNVDGVQQVISLPQAAKIVNAGWNEGNIRWRVLPRDNDTLRQVTQGFETDSGLLNADCSAMPVMIFTADHKAETISRLVGAVKKFRDDEHLYSGPDFRKKLDTEVQSAGASFHTDQVNLRLATGNVGVMAATNEQVKAAELPMLLWVYAAVFVLCLVTYRSLFATLAIVLPLVLVSLLANALMVYLNIGLKVNTLPVVALGVGIGVDYAIYIYSRMKEFLDRGAPLVEAYFNALKLTGTAVVFTALTLAVGVGTWIFSELKFQADMGMLLAFMFIMNLIGAVVLLPALLRWLVRPRERVAKS